MRGFDVRALCLSVLVLAAGLVLAETDFAKSTDDLVKAWAQAETAPKRQDAMLQSTAFLRRQLGATTPEQIAQVARVFGAIYAWDYDPMGDVLSLFAKRLGEPDFRRAFDDELARLPAGDRDKLTAAVKRLAERPDCRYRGKNFVCTEAK